MILTINLSYVVGKLWKTLSFTGKSGKYLIILVKNNLQIWIPHQFPGNINLLIN